MLDKIAELARGSSVLVTTHVNADPDALASAYLIAHVAKSVGANHVDVFLPGGPSAVSKKIMRELMLPRPVDKLNITYDVVIIVDTSCSELLGPAKDLVEGSAVAIIDHHVSGGDLIKRARLAIVEQEVATSVIIADLMVNGGLKPNAKLSTLALCGILYDSRRFTRATPRALRVTAYLIELGGAYDKALKLLSEEQPLSEKIAKLKGAQRAIIVRFSTFLIAASQVSAHEAAVARALLSLGADVAVVAGGKRGEVRICARASPSFVKKTGVRLGEFMSELARYIPGKGGGHDQAAGFNGRGDPSRALNLTVRLLLSKLASRGFRTAGPEQGLEEF